MKAVLLFLAGIFLFAGCNNLDKITEPHSDMPALPPPELKPCEFLISAGEVIHLDEYRIGIQCLSINKDSNNSYKILLSIDYFNSQIQDNWVEFSTLNSDYNYTLESDPGAELKLLGVEKNGYEKKARLKLSPAFRW